MDSRVALRFSLWLCEHRFEKITRTAVRGITRFKRRLFASNISSSNYVRNLPDPVTRENVVRYLGTTAVSFPESTSHVEAVQLLTEEEQEKHLMKYLVNDRDFGIQWSWFAIIRRLFIPFHFFVEQGTHTFFTGDTTPRHLFTFFSSVTSVKIRGKQNWQTQYFLAIS